MSDRSDSDSLAIPLATESTIARVVSSILSNNLGRAGSRRQAWRDIREPHSVPMLKRIATSQIHLESSFWGAYPAHELKAVGVDLLFRPRLWVRNEVDCVMRKFALRARNFVAMHVRFSKSKAKERGNGMPKLDVYVPAAAAALKKYNVTKLFLQTATPAAIQAVANWCNASGIELSYTDNERASFDLWVVPREGGRPLSDRSGERSSVVAQAVNSLVASRAKSFISPAQSMWTNFVQALMHRPKRHSMAVSYKSGVDRMLTEVSREATIYRTREDAVVLYRRGGTMLSWSHEREEPPTNAYRG